MELCKICDMPVHNHPYRHPFTSEGVDPGSALRPIKEEKKPSVKVALAGDPVLRIALLNAGVITVAQLAAAEEELENARAGGTTVHTSASASGSSSTSSA